ELRAGRDVAPAVAREQRRRRVQPVLPRGQLEARGRRLATIAGPREVGMMRTHIAGVDPRPLAAQHFVQPLSNALVLLVGEEAARDARLIRDDDDGDVRMVETPNRVGGARQENELRGVAQVVAIVDDRPVAVQKCRAPAMPSVGVGDHAGGFPEGAAVTGGGTARGEGLGTVTTRDDAPERPSRLRAPVTVTTYVAPGS